MGKFKRALTRQIADCVTFEELHGLKIAEQLIRAVANDLITPNEGKVLMELAAQKVEKLLNGPVARNDSERADPDRTV